MRRREFISLLGDVFFAGTFECWSFSVCAQQPDRIRRIGVLMNLSESDPEGQARIAAFREGLNKLAWIEGRNIQIEYRWAGGDAQRMRGYAAELVSLKPDAIFAATAGAALALQRETSIVPIVFAQTIDPVGSGLVSSAPRPGGNITGFALYEFAIASHWVELLKEIAPDTTRIAAIYDPANPAAPGHLPMLDAGARKHGIELTAYAVRNDGEIESAIETFAREPNGGLIPLPSELIAVKRELIISLTEKYRLPNLYAFRYYPVSGGLASYGADNIDTYRAAADYIDRILKGEKPADLPVQFPTKYQFVINLKTAKALGLSVPQTLLATADEVIE